MAGVWEPAYYVAGNTPFTAEWLRLNRKDSRLAFCRSEDGQSWTEAGAVNLSTVAGVTPLTGSMAAGVVMQTH